MPIKITTKVTAPKESPNERLFWQRLIGFCVVAAVILGAVLIFGKNQPVFEELAVTVLPALVSWFVGKLYFEPIHAVTRKAIRSMPPEKASDIIEFSLRSMPPNIAADIIERASQRPPPLEDSHGSQKET